MKENARKRMRHTRCQQAGLDAVENPLDFIAGDHERERKVCVLIDRLVAGGLLTEGEKRKLLAFLENQLPHHLDDEELDLFPLMLKRCEPEDEIEKVIAKLQGDHGHAEADTQSVAACLNALFAAPFSRLSTKDRKQLSRFSFHARRHLTVENAIILPIAHKRLSDADLTTMRRHMLERRSSESFLENDAC